ncbi:MAG: penicillin-binding transpeptidase domain-containing protein [Pseudomonadota bacterium]
MMKRLFATCTITLMTLGAATFSEPINIAENIQAPWTQDDTITIVVQRASDEHIWISNPSRAARQFSPASTSKIPHTLIALETELATPDTLFPWDGILRSSPHWNKDQTLQSAFQHSAVWVFQNIAQAAGVEVVADGLAQLTYGNEDVGTDRQLTTYWLDGTLQISAFEQVDFLMRLVRKQLPVSAETYRAAQDIMISDQSDDWVMRAKTGWYDASNDMDIGWFIGWVTCANDTYVFAMNMDMPDTRFLSKRKDVAYSALTAIGSFDCE